MSLAKQDSVARPRRRTVENRPAVLTVESEFIERVFRCGPERSLYCNRPGAEISLKDFRLRSGHLVIWHPEDE
jgi:hypothetical protein